MASSGPGELADLDLRCLSTNVASAEPRVEAQPLRDRVRCRSSQGRDTHPQVSLELPRSRARNTAMECAELWTTLDCTKNLDLAEMMFQRSKNAPLAVTFNVALDSGPHFALFRLLHCDLNDDGIFDSMPVLEEVIIDAPNYEPIGVGIPALKSLRAIPPASSLTSLIVDNTFLQSLRHATHLQNIKMYHFLPSDAYPSPTIPLSFMLPCIANFLTSIKFMTACKITFLIEASSELIPLLDQCFGALSKAWMGPPNSGRAREEVQRLELDKWIPKPPKNQFPTRFFSSGKASTTASFTKTCTTLLSPLRNLSVRQASLPCHWSTASTPPLDRFGRPSSALSLTRTLLCPFVKVLEPGLAYPGMLPLLPALLHVQLSGSLYWASVKEVSKATLSLAKIL
ncbi:hypothetical protein FA13DRAFT_1744726, partial [Coprinellus micaceus]